MKIFPALIGVCSLALLATVPAAEVSKEKEQLEQQQLLALVKEVQSQQVSIAENQTKMDEKLAAIAEAVRVARIYSSRGGR
jgi:hypothetical protein